MLDWIVTRRQLESITGSAEMSKSAQNHTTTRQEYLRAGSVCPTAVSRLTLGAATETITLNHFYTMQV